MIGKLKGLIDSYGEDYVILDVGGVGYQVHCSARTLQALAAPGEAAALSIETYVREDQIKLFGFRSDLEREWFRLLQTVQGVGAKVALAVLSTLPPSDLANAIALRDKAAVIRTPGVGPKVAERIVTELKDKAPAFANVDPALVHLSGAIDNDRAPRPVTDAISALVNLGYGQPQAAAAIAGASRLAGEGAETAQLIRLGLKELAKGTRPPASLPPIAAPMTSAIRRCARSCWRNSSARPRRAPTSRSSSRPPASATRRWIMCCSSVRPASARPRWRRLWRVNSASAFAPPRALSSPRRAISPRC